MPHRIVVNLDVLRKNPECKAQCSYPFRKSGTLAGPSWLRQKAAFEVFCRRCDDYPCVNACPSEALERLEDGKIKRYNYRCTQCNSCMVACPFGTIVPTALVFRDAMCDLCVGRDDPAPLCTQTCECGAFAWEEMSDQSNASDKSNTPNTPYASDLHIINERLAVRTKAFTKVEPPLRKKK